MKNPVYFIWYELVVGEERSRLQFELKFAFANKRAETKDEMTQIHTSALNHITAHHGGEGRTVNITGMEFLRLEENKEKSKSKNDANGQVNTKKNTRSRT